MEAKTWQDTVMNPLQQKAIINLHSNIGSRHFYSAGERLSQSQAEITWKARDQEIEAAHKAGLREAVEWINKEPTGQPYSMYPGFILISPERQSQLKEWGIE